MMMMMMTTMLLWAVSFKLGTNMRRNGYSLSPYHHGASGGGQRDF
jgi:hypothetical protein